MVLFDFIYSELEAMSLDEHSSSIMSEDEPPSPSSHHTHPRAPIPNPHSPLHRDVRHRGFPYAGISTNIQGTSQDNEPGYVVIPKPENLVEAQRLVNNYTVSF